MYRDLWGKPNLTPEEFEELKKLALRRARITSIVLGTAAVVAVLSMVYGFTQSIEASKQRDIAIMREFAADSAKNDALHQKELAEAELRKCKEEKK